MKKNMELIRNKSLQGFDQQNYDITDKDEGKYFYIHDPSTYEYSPVCQDNNSTVQIQKNYDCSFKQTKKTSLFQCKAKSFEKNNQNELIQNRNSTYGWNNCRILRTYDKILQKYLQKLSLQKDCSKDTFKFINCTIFRNLQLQNRQETLKEKIGKCSFSYFQKNKFIMQIQQFQSLKQFLIDILNESYCEINQEILYFIKVLLDFLKEFIQNCLSSKKQQQKMKIARKLSFQFIQQNYKQQKNKIQFEMRELLDNNQFLINIYYCEHINYLNFKKLYVNMEPSVIKNQFELFMKSFTKIVVKLIAVDLVNIKQFTNNTKQIKSQEKQQKIIEQSNDNQNKKDRLKISFINSYKSLNSVTSVNFRELNLYESKPDLWSQSDSEENEGYLRKKKRKLS